MHICSTISRKLDDKLQHRKSMTLVILAKLLVIGNFYKIIDEELRKTCSFYRNTN